MSIGSHHDFSTISPKGDNFCDFLFAALEEQSPANRRFYL